MTREVHMGKAEESEGIYLKCCFFKVKYKKHFIVNCRAYPQKFFREIMDDAYHQWHLLEAETNTNLIK